jgi:multiple sugar transport system substrate-binding protein
VSTISALAGCSTVGDGESEGTTTGSASDDTVELVWWHQENVPHRIDIFEELNQRFMDEHDNIEVTQQPQTWADIYGKLQSAVEAGNQPDFWFNTPALAMRFQAQGDLVDVSEMMDELDSEYEYYDKAKAQYQYDDGTWGIPNWNKGFNYVYRQDVFEGTDGFPPENWEDWLTAMQGVTDGDQHGYVLGATNSHFAYKGVYNMMAMKGSYVFGPDGDIMFNTEETVQMLDFYKEVFDSAVPDDAVDWGWAEWDRSLRQGNVVSTSCYTAPFPNIEDRETQKNWAVMKNPAPSGGPWGDGESRRFVSIDGVSVFSEDKLDAVTKYMKFIHRPDVYGWWMRTLNPTLFVPIHESGWDSDEYWKDTHNQSPFREMIEKQHSLDDMAYPGFRDMHLENDTYVGEGLGVIEGSFPLGEIVGRLITNDESPEQVAEWGQNRLEEVTGLGTSGEL